MPISSELPDSSTRTLPVLAEGDRLASGAGAWQTMVQDIVPGYLERRRWFARDGKSASARWAYRADLPLPTTAGDAGRELTQDRFALTEIEVDTAAGTVRYFVPLASLWSEATPLARDHALAALIAGDAAGLLTDAYTVAAFAHGVINALRRALVIDVVERDGPARLCFLPEAGLPDVDTAADAPVKWFLGEQSNSSLAVGGEIMLKLVRRVADDINPEAEMTRRLTRVGFGNGAALLGEVVRRRPDGSQATLAVAHRSIANEGDAWGWTESYLASRLASSTAGEPGLDEYAIVAGAIGRRLAQMHDALTQPTDDPAFAPETASAQDARAWRDDIVAMLARARHALAALPLTATAAVQRDWLDANTAALEAAIDRRVQALVGSLRIRIHGDFHLGQVLIANRDAYLIDFEGEPARSPAERRAKNTPLRDVAGLLRSFAYARAAFLPKPAAAPTDPQDMASERLRDAFVHSADHAFLAAYRQALTQADNPWFTPATLDALLGLAIMEKAAYEVVYEAGHRPSWLHIPLTGLVETAGRILANDAIPL